MQKWLFLLLMCIACRQKTNSVPVTAVETDTAMATFAADTASRIAAKDSSLPDKIVAFAKTQLGVRYRYCSMTPEGGFDCSGFVNYVFNHFNIKVPRSSADFANIGEEVPLSRCHPGDLILFTGTDPHARRVGHIGIITANDNGDISFIQSTSGAAYSVVISPLDKRYMARFVKVVRIVK
jgi:cell wall-associated NlpC family hydrolase